MLHEMLNLKEDQDSTVQGKDEWKDEKMWRSDAHRQVRWRQMGEGFLCPRFLVVDDCQTSQWTVRYPWAQDGRRGVHSYVVHLICFIVWNRKPWIWLQFGEIVRRKILLRTMKNTSTLKELLCLLPSLVAFWISFFLWPWLTSPPSPHSPMLLVKFAKNSTLVGA